MSAPLQMSDKFVRQVISHLVPDQEAGYDHVGEIRGVFGWLPRERQQQVLRSKPEDAVRFFCNARDECAGCEELLGKPGFTWVAETSMIHGDGLAWSPLAKSAATKHLVKWRRQKASIYAQCRQVLLGQSEVQAIPFPTRGVLSPFQTEAEYAQSQRAPQAPPAKITPTMSKKTDSQRALNPEDVQHILDHHQAPQSPPSTMGSPQPHLFATPATHRYPLPIAKILSAATQNRVPDDCGPYADEEPYEDMNDMAEQPEAADEEALSEADEVPAPAANKKKRKGRGKMAAQKAAVASAAISEASKARIEDYMAANGGVLRFLAPDVEPKQPATTSRAQRSRRAAVAHFHTPQAAMLAHVEDEDEEDEDKAEDEQGHNHEHDTEGEGAAAHSHPHPRTHHGVEVEDDDEDDHDHGCTCGRNLASTPPIPCIAAPRASVAYSTKEYERVKTHYSKDKIPMLVKASSLKLRADHAHNTWYGLVIAVRECQCSSCSDPIYNEDRRTVGNTVNSNASYSILIEAAREEYQKLDAQLDVFLTSQRMTIFQEWLTTNDGKGWPKELDLSIGQIRGMLPDGRDGTLDVASKPDVDFERVMRNMMYGDERKAKRVAGKEGGAAQKAKK